jgi:hypothetical protein
MVSVASLTPETPSQKEPFSIKRWEALVVFLMLALIIVVLMDTSFGSPGRAARKRWERNGSDYYSITVEGYGGMLGLDDTIIVRNGYVIDAGRSFCHYGEPAEDCGLTVEGLLKSTEHCESPIPDSIKVSCSTVYHPHYGIPMSHTERCSGVDGSVVLDCDVELRVVRVELYVVRDSDE